MVFLYKKKVPTIDDIVIATVSAITEYGVNVILPEYDNIKGYISYSEISRKKKFNINKLIAVDNDIHVIVISIDNDKNYIDLSKRSISDEETNLFIEKNKKHVHLYNIFKIIYMKINKITNPNLIIADKIENFMTNTLWKLQETNDNDVLYDKLLNKNTNDEYLDTLDNFEQIKVLLNDYIDNKLNNGKKCLNKIIKLITYNIDGLENIKYTLDYQNFDNYINIASDFNIKINYMCNSNYNISIERKKQLVQNNEDENGSSLTCENIYDLLIQEIQKRATNKEINYEL